MKHRLFSNFTINSKRYFIFVHNLFTHAFVLAPIDSKQQSSKLLATNVTKKLDHYTAHVFAVYLYHGRIFIIIIVQVNKNLCAVQYVDTWLDIQFFRQVFLDITVIEGNPFLTFVFRKEFAYHAF